MTSNSSHHHHHHDQPSVVPPSRLSTAAVLSLKEALLQGNAIYVLDGGVSTHLQWNLCRGIPFCYPELWSSSLLLSNNEDQETADQEIAATVASTSQTRSDDDDYHSKQFACHGHELIYQGHLDWLQAGANIVSTVTYQCHYESRLWPHHASLSLSSVTMDTMMETAVDLARRAIADGTDQQHLKASETQPVNCRRRRRPQWIAVSLGCFGAALANGAEYTGAYCETDLEHQDNPLPLARIGTKTIDELMVFHQPRILKAIELKDVDAIALETIPSLLECKALVKLLTSPTFPSDTQSSLPAFWISLACRNGSELNDGTPVVQALRVLREIPVDILQGIGFNCCDSQYLRSLCQLLVQEYLEHAAAADAINSFHRRLGAVRAILLYPNSGETYDADAKDWVPHTGCRDGSTLADRLSQIVHDIRDQWRKGMTDMEKQEGIDKGPLPVPTIVLGGCCRTQPDTISRLRHWVDAQTQEH